MELRPLTTAADEPPMACAPRPVPANDADTESDDGLSEERVLAIMQALRDEPTKPGKPKKPPKSELEKMHGALRVGLADQLLGDAQESGEAIRTILFNLVIEYRAVGMLVDTHMRGPKALTNPLEAVEALLPLKIIADDKLLEVISTMLRLQQPVVPSIRATQVNLGMQQLNVASSSDSDGMSKIGKTTTTSEPAEE